tara:strand:- start:869 stop:2392 length:1524 start_codon:yes stop_codon:yes gene_type:complete
MTIIQQEDIIVSIADSLQYISYYHPPDFVRAMTNAYQREESIAARNAIAQILTNSRMASEGHRPICQDTGIVVVFVKIGMEIKLSGNLTLQEMIDEGVRRAWKHPENPLRPSVVTPPFGKRKNTQDNTPAVVHTEFIRGDKIDFVIAAKGGGSENKAKLEILNPGDDISEWVITTVSNLGAGWCPPGILGLGLGGTPEKALLLAKEALMSPIDIGEIIHRGATTEVEKLRIEIYEKVNALGIGAQGLGGLTTVLDVKLLEYPTHAASLPVALIPNCAATRHIHFSLDGSGPIKLEPPSTEIWPQLTLKNDGQRRRVNLNAISREDVRDWKPGETLLLTGTILTGRDAAHKRLCKLLDAGLALPEGVDFTNRFIYYVGPVDPIGDEVVGPAGPTTASRMDKFTDTMLEKTKLIGMIGKGERGSATIDSIRKNRSVYLIAVGGAAYLVSKAIRSAKLVAFEDLGMEAIYEFEIKDMPVTVAIDTHGESLHSIGPKIWKNKISNIPVAIK